MTARARAERIAEVAAGLYLHALLWLVVAAVVPVVVLGWRPAVITSGSMAPALDAGDLVITTPAPAGDLVEMGSLVLFQEEGRDQPIVHRIIGIDGRGGYWTKGDANPKADATPVPFEAVKGVGKVVVPWVGSPFVWSQGGELPLLAGWAVLTAGAVAVRWRRRRRLAEQALALVRTDDDLLASPVLRRRTRKALAAVGTGLVIATGLVMVPAQAAFSSVTSNTGNYFASAATFPIQARGTVGSATTCTASTTTALTIGASGVSIGRTIILQLTIKEEGTTPPTVSAVDSRGNTYTVHANVLSGGTRTRTVVMSTYVTTALQSGDTITVTHTGSVAGKGVHVFAAAFSGVAPTNPVNVSNTAIGNGTPISVAATTTWADTLVWGGISNRDPATFTEDTDFINLFNTNHNCSGVQHGNHAGYRILSSAATETYNPTFTGDPREWAAAIVAFKAADVVAPAAPVLGGGGGDTQVVLTWSAVTDPSTPVTYILYRDGVQVYSGTDLSFNDTGLTNGVEYDYTVKAKDAYDNLSPASNTFSLTPTSGSSIVHVKALGSSTCGTTSSVVTIPAGGVPQGNSVIVRLVLREAAAGAISAVDSRGNTYAVDLDYNPNKVRVAFLSTYVTTALQAGDTITVTHPSGKAAMVDASEYSGLAATDRVGLTATNFATSNAPTVSITTNTQRTLLLGAVGTADAVTNGTVTGWTATAGGTAACGGGSGTRTGGRRVEWSTGTFTFNPSANASKDWAAVIIAYKSTDATAPAAPALSGVRGDTEVDLSWNAVSDPSPPVTYQLYRGTDLIYDGTATSYTDTGRTNGTQYSYTVKATDGATNQSVASNTVNVTPLINASIKFIRSVGNASCQAATSTTTVVNVPADGVPLGHTLIARVAIREDDVSSAISAVDSKGNTWTLDLDTSPNKQRTALLSAYIATPLVSGDTITVTHPNGKVEVVHVSEWRGIAASSRVDVTGVGSGNTVAPSAALTTTQAHTLVYGAISNTDIATYTEATGWTTESHQNVPNAGNCTDDADTHGAFLRPKVTGTYTYNPTLSTAEEWAEIVVAYKWAGSDATAPAAPTLSGTAFHQRNELSWTAVTDPSYPVVYKLLRDDVEIYSGGNLSYSDTGRTNGVQYVYKVRAVDAWSNTSPDSNTQSLTPTADSTPPSVPTLSGTAGNNQNDLSWTAVTDDSPPITYQLFRDDVEIWSGSATSYSDVGTTNGQAYVYEVRASDGVPNQSVDSNAVTPVASVVSAAVIGKTAGGLTGYIGQGGTYHVYANATAGSTTITADVSTITTGQTAVVLTAGSYTAGGVSYGYRSAQLTADNPLTDGSKAFTVNPSGGTTFNASVTADSTPLVATDIQNANTSGGIVGRPETGDTVTYTFNATDISAESILAGWNGSSTNVTVQIFQDGSTDDLITVHNAANTAQLPLGSIDTNGDPVSSTAVFSSSTMVLSGTTITVTLGTLTAGSVRTDNKTTPMVWTPSASLTDFAGNPMSTATATESGAVDIGF